VTDSTWKDWIRPDGIDDLEALGFVGDTSDPADWSQYTLTDDDTQTDLYQTNDIADVISYINAMIANVERYGATARQLRYKEIK
jgi:hypothetical protein